MERVKNNRFSGIAILSMIGILVIVLGQFASMARTENKDVHAEEEVQAEPTNPQVVISTNHGSIRVELLYEKSPVSVKNFLDYADQGFYQGTIFHRVIPGFMIQGGGFNREMEQEKPTMKPIRNEADNGLKNRRGTLAMARTMQIDSATSQFFINLADNEFLDHGHRDFGYAVFGRVIEGMAVVDKIAGVAAGSFGMHQNVPEEPVIIKEVKRVAAEQNDDDCAD